MTSRSDVAAELRVAMADTATMIESSSRQLSEVSSMGRMPFRRRLTHSLMAHAVVWTLSVSAMWGVGFDLASAVRWTFVPYIIIQGLITLVSHAVIAFWLLAVESHIDARIKALNDCARILRDGGNK